MTLPELLLSVSAESKPDLGEDGKLLEKMWEKHRGSTTPTPLGFSFWLMLKCLEQKDRSEAAKKSIDKRLADLETKSVATLADSFQGPHIAGRQYARGMIVQKDGGLWLAMAATSLDDAPGKSSNWRLVVKAPR